MNMKRLSKYVRVFKRINAYISDYMTSFIREIPSSQLHELRGLFVILALEVLSLACYVHIGLVIVGKADPAYFGLWYMVAVLSVFSAVVYLFLMVSRRSASLRVRIRSKMLTCLLVHVVYVFCILVSFMQFTSEIDGHKLVPVNRVPTMPSVCLGLLTLVELTACFLCFHDVFFDLERMRPSRWWIRTTPYPVIGMIFLLFFNLWNEDRGGGEDYSLIFSVAVTVLAVDYLVQIINERIVPREGPYKETHMAVCNRPVRNRPVYHRRFPKRAHVRRLKPSSPSAGRGEGAC